MSLKAVEVLSAAREGSSSQACSSMGDLSTRSKDTQAAVLSLGMLNEGFRSRETEERAEEGGGRRVKEEEEGASLAPETPQRAPRPAPGTPLTPLANLKVLIAAASSALERESASGGRGEESMDGGTGDDCRGRKMKSLSVLCQRFLAIADKDVGVGNDFSLELMSQKLGTNRRRIYDIINVLEALEMIVKQSKNWYTWLGKENLLLTLAKMRAMAQDDPDFRHLNNENIVQSSLKPTDDHHSSSALVDKTNFLSTLNDQPPCVDASTPQSDHTHSCTHTRAVVEYEESVPPVCGACGGNNSGGRWDKSLGVLCQKFVMLFLVTPDHEVTLDYAGNMLMPDCVDSMGNPFAAMHQPTNPKTKVRRLYDIANVLTTLGLIKKKTFLAPNHRKMPGYAWAGPSVEEIQAIPVFRKNEFNLYPFYSKKKGVGPSVGGVALTRKGSFGGGVRPFLHQYGVKGHGSSSEEPAGNKEEGTDGGKYSSAPTSPVKSRVVRRTLSFGAQPTKGATRKISRQSSVSSNSSSTSSGSSTSSVNQSAPVMPVVHPPAPPSTSSKCVVARPLVPKQVDYMNEVKEFEAEMRKHSHKFPHVASVFQEFIQKYQSTLEQAASAGRTILPKPVPLEDGSTSCQAALVSQNVTHPSHLLPSVVEVAASSAPLHTGGSATLKRQLQDQPLSTSVNVTSIVTSQQATQSSFLPSSSQPSALIQLGDIDINGVAKPEMTSSQSLPMGCRSPGPTLDSATYGILKSPGPSGTPAFRSVEDVMVRSPKPARGTQTTSSNLDSAVPSSANKSTMLASLLKASTSTTTSNTLPQPIPPPVITNMALPHSGVQQALVSTILNSLVNQSPIPTPAAFKKPQVTTPTSKPNVVVGTSGSTLATKISPQIQQVQIPRAVNLSNAFNPSMFLANPAQTTPQQLMNGAASSGNILPNTALTLSSYLASLPAIYGNSLVQTPPTFTSTDPAKLKNMSTSTSCPLSVTVSKESNDGNGPSPPKKPRLE